jgi:hypothetical protein
MREVPPQVPEPNGYAVDGFGWPEKMKPSRPQPAYRIICRANRLEAMTSQPDFFAKNAQADLFGAEAIPAYRPDPDKVRSRLYKILGEARAAEKLPWEPTRLSLYRTIVLQMTLWLPDDEGAQLRLEIETELARLEAA